jgi:gluconolactonase
VLAVSTAGLFDGFRVDAEGRVWASTDEGVPSFEPDGTLIGKILIPEIVANVTFGSAKRNHLFVCGRSSLYPALLMTNGSKLG